MDLFSTIYQHWSDRHDPECNRAFTRAWWYLLLGIAVAIVVCVGMYAAWSLWDMRQVAGAETQIQSPSETVSREDLRETLRAFEQRKVDFDFLVANPPQIIDPSR